MSDGFSLGEVIQTMEFFWRIGRDLSAAAMKIFTVLYYAKHEGQTSFRRLTKAADQTAFLELGTQEESAVREFCRKLDAYKILYARLPDLNLSDRRCQIAFDASQAQAVQAVVNLLSAERLQKLQELKSRHAPGSSKYQEEKKEIEARFPSVSFISASDYALTRLDKDGKETPEYQDLEGSAKENLRQETKKEERKKETERAAPEGPTAEQKAASVTAAKQRAENNALLASGKAETLQLPSPLETERFQIAGEEKVIRRLRYPDGGFSVIIPEKHILDDRNILIENGRTYRVLCNDPFSVKHVKGSQVLKELKPQLAKAVSHFREHTRPLSSPVPEAARQKGRKR